MDENVGAQRGVEVDKVHDEDDAAITMREEAGGDPGVCCSAWSTQGALTDSCASAGEH